MSNIKMGLRLAGNLPSDEIILNSVKANFKLIRRGETNIIGDIIDSDVLTIRLARWEDEKDISSDDQIQLVVERLTSMKPWLISLDKSQIKTEFYVSTLRTIDQGGFDLPSELVAAISAAGLSLAVSILVVLDDDPG